MTITKENLKEKVWRLNHLYKIKDKESNLGRFKLNPAQENFRANRWHRNIILKSRQLGFTSYEAIDSLDDCLWTPNFDALFISYDDPSALEIFDNKISLAWEHYPNELKRLYTLDADRANKLKFGFGDGTYSSIIVKSQGRSGTYHRLHVSELGKICAKYPAKAKEIVSGTIPAVPLDGRVDIESTAEGEVGLFHDMFWEAWLGGAPEHKTQFKAHFYNWTWDKAEIAKVQAILPLSQMDGRDFFEEVQIKHNLSDLELTYYYLKWLQLAKDFSLLKQEYPSTPEEAFIASGRKLFAPEKVLEHQERYAKEGTKRGHWTVYAEYLSGHIYAIGADTAEGIGRDANAAVVWDFTYRPKVVATYRNNRIGPDQFAYELKEYGHKYGTCLVAPERNNTGHATIAKLKELYPGEKIYREFKTDEEEDRETVRLGWHTNLATKPKMLYDLVTIMNEEFVEIPSKELLLEMRTYDQDDLQRTKADEEQTAHWDLLMAAAIGFQMRGEARRASQSLATVQLNNTHQDIHSAI